MNSLSQAGQDLFVSSIWPWLHDDEPNTFLDIGCAGLTISNTLALEQIGWRGWLVDNSEEARIASVHRASPFYLDDAIRLNYLFLPQTVGYLSLDCDQWSMGALHRVFDTAPNTLFRVVTCEHDSYQRGETLRTPMLELLADAGYDVLCADVCHEGKPFEIWAVHPDIVDMERADKFRRDKPTEWKDMFNAK